MQQRRRPSPDGRPLNEVVADAIRAGIITGRYRPGDRLGEERLAAEYEVSRNPIREAIRRLESEGFVRVLPNRGATVGHLSDEQARELLQVRSALETLIVRLAAERRDAGRLAELRAIVAEGRAAAGAGRFEVLSAMNGRFHAELAAASGNATLAEMMAQLRDKIAWIYASEIERRATDSWAEHAELVAAIERGDVEGAGELMARHISNAEHAYVLRHQR